MTNSRKLFADEFTYQLINEVVFTQYQFQMSIYYKYEPDGTKIVALSYVYDCVYWYTSKALGKWFVKNLGNILYVDFLSFSHWFMSMSISKLK